MLTTAVFAVVITAPLGAIMINTLGTKWLDYDGEDPKLLAKHGKIMPLSTGDDAPSNPELELQTVKKDGIEEGKVISKPNKLNTVAIAPVEKEIIQESAYPDLEIKKSSLPDINKK